MSLDECVHSAPLRYVRTAFLDFSLFRVLFPVLLRSTAYPVLSLRSEQPFVLDMTLFRPCIDLHAGKVKQIVGGTLSDDGAGLQTNFESDRPAGYYGDLYRQDALTGGHVIKLGPDNDRAAREALAAYPRGLQVGGGIRRENAASWLEAGASHVIVTSWLFDDEGHFRVERLDTLVAEVGKARLVLDLSCRSDGAGWVVAMNRWQTPTDLSVNAATLCQLAHSCDEFLVHAADVEGKCEGIDTRLVEFLGAHVTIPVTYAGGVHTFNDLQTVHDLSRGKVDLTIGSALDLFGGNQVCYADCVAWNRERGGVR
jgi:phosphoribosylformimino-5-aminoimidazole carboxamide ribotide isomerase